MNIPAIPTSDVGVLQGLLRTLEADVTKIQQNPNEATLKQRAVAWATGSVAVAFFALADQAIHATCLAAKAIPVAFKVSIGKVTGLDKYITSPALTGEDFVAHITKIRDCFALQLVAVGVFFGANPNTVVLVSKNLNVIPTGQAGAPAVDKTA